MSWCDKLASTPSIGLRLSKEFRSSSSILDALGPLLSSWRNGESDGFTLEKQDSFAVELTTEDGFHYGIDPSRIFIDFRHRIKLKPVSAGPPTVEMLSRAQPYTELLPDVCRRLLAIADLLVDVRTRHLERIGIVSTTVVLEKEAPPGILKFIDYVQRPWNADASQYDFQIMSPLGEDESWMDHCLHHIAKTEAGEGLATLKFDWQRWYKSHKALSSSSSLKGMVQSAQDAALLYFEEIAQGDRFDVNNHSKETN